MSIRSLGYLTIETTDVQKWQLFGSTVLGLEATQDSSEQLLKLRMDDYPYRLRIVRGTEDRYVLPGWETEDQASFNTLIEKLQALGLACKRGGPAETAERQVSEFVHVVDPTGTAFEIYYGMQLDYQPLISPAGIKQFITGESGDMGLGHIAITTPDLGVSHDFYRDTMAFGQTDYMEFVFGEQGQPAQGLHFLHCDNPRHHSLALFHDPLGPSGSLVHMMVEVPDMDHVGRFIDRVKQAGVEIVNPLGKHTNDEMISIYVKSPAGFAVEFGYGGKQPDWATYKPTISAKASVWGHSWDHQ